MYVSKVADVSAKQFLFDDLPRLAFVAFISIQVSSYLNKYLESNFIGVICLTLINLVLVITMFSIFVVKSKERKDILRLIRKRFK